MESVQFKLLLASNLKANKSNYYPTSTNTKLSHYSKDGLGGRT